MLMRIIGGKSKGRRISVPGHGVRPTKGIIRGAIFNIVSDRIADALILDVFAGSGAMGLEAISRGAKSVVFIEKNPRPLLENIRAIHDDTKSVQVIKGDFRFGLRKVIPRRFDIIFVDPPYSRDYVQKTLVLISKYHLLKDDGIIVVEHHRTNQFSIPRGLSLLRKKQYQDTELSFVVYEKPSACLAEEVLE